MRTVATASMLVIAIVIFATVLPVGASEDGKMPLTTSSEKAHDLYLKGRDLFEKLQPTDSREYFQKAVQVDPDFAAAHLQLAQAQPSAALFRESLNRAIALMDKVSDAEKLWIQAVEAGAINGDPIKQQKLYKKLATLCPNDERVLTLLGTNHFALQQWDDAILCLRKATELNSSFSPAYNMLGYSYRTIEQNDKAEQAFKKYVELIPNDPNPYDSYAELLMKTGRFDESIDMYRKALDVNPDFQPSYNGIACNQIFLGKYDAAATTLKEMYERAKDDGQRRNAMLSMANMYLDKGDFDAAIRILNDRLDMSKRDHDTAAMAGDIALIAFAVIEVPGRGEEALELFSKANQLLQTSSLPEQTKAIAQTNFLYNSGRAYWAMGEIEQARVALDGFRKSAQERQNSLLIFNAHQLAGMIALSEGDYDTAVKELERSNMQNPYDLFYLAKAFEGKGNTEKARKYYQKVADFNGLNNGLQASVRRKAASSLKSM